MLSLILLICPLWRRHEGTSWDLEFQSIFVGF